MPIREVVKMIKEEIAPGIVVYSNVIPNSDTLYQDIEDGIISAGLSWNEAGVKESADATVNKKTRDTSTFGVEYAGQIKDAISTDLGENFNISLNNIFFEHFSVIEKDYLDSYGINCDWHDSYGILKYGEGQFFSNHIDDHKDYHRRVSTVYYMNDNYTGGEINFPRFGITFKPKANQMIVFPSNYVYNHSVSPVIEGSRYAVVGWLR
jgi:Rps23 Pro-64 3,4-dihydroxylase Tpa1-like proline 4-hydroxylase